MTDLFWQTFFAVYEHIPRQGPGSAASTARALAYCDELPSAPRVFDMGCGTGAQTLDVARLLPEAQLTALDTHAPFIETLNEQARAQGLADRVTGRTDDMASPPAEAGSLDLIWSEGAAYFLGVAQALDTWRPLLRSGGYLAFTEASWLVDDPPQEIRDFWAAEYPDLKTVAANKALALDAGYRLCAHFTLPDDDWFDEFYTPMRARIKALRPGLNEPVARQALDTIEAEIELFERHHTSYGYEFFVLQKP